MADPSNGYDAIADAFVTARSASGRAIIDTWARGLPPGASVIDIGAGHGEPLTAALIEAGLSVWAVDASPKLVAAFRQRFPNVPMVCEPAETSDFFGQTFDAALAVGLIFLLAPDAQRVLIYSIAKALKPGGRLLFSAPWQMDEWTDVLTGQTSISLGREVYLSHLSDAGLHLVAEHSDEGGSHYYEAQKGAPAD